MKIIDVISSRFLLIFLEISENFRKISGNIKFLENSQPYQATSQHQGSWRLALQPLVNKPVWPWPSVRHSINWSGNAKLIDTTHLWSLPQGQMWIYCRAPPNWCTDPAYPRPCAKKKWRLQFAAPYQRKQLLKCRSTKTCKLVKT